MLVQTLCAHEREQNGMNEKQKMANVHQVNRAVKIAFRNEFNTTTDDECF